jgi:hypothetical protein
VNTIETFENCSLKRGVQLWDILYTLIQNEAKVERIYFFANSKIITDHFVLLFKFIQIQKVLTKQTPNSI